VAARVNNIHCDIPIVTDKGQTAASDYAAVNKYDVQPFKHQ